MLYTQVYSSCVDCIRGACSDGFSVFEVDGRAGDELVGSNAGVGVVDAGSSVGHLDGIVEFSFKVACCQCGGME